MSGTDIFAAAAEVQSFCQSHQWQFCFIGGIAVQRWGTPRFTQDVDLTLLTGFGSEEQFIDPLLQQFPGRLRNARQFAVQNRVVLARTHGGIDLDIAMGGLPFEENSIGRASLWRVSPHLALLTCSAEDLIVHKVFAGRDRDWSDVQGVITRQFDHLDVGLIQTELSPLLELKGDSDSLRKLEQFVTKARPK